jgi:hypothetical protein
LQKYAFKQACFIIQIHKQQQKALEKGNEEFYAEERRGDKKICQDHDYKIS